MRLDWALLANAAEGPPNGLVYMLGAGIDTLWRDSFPAPFAANAVVRVLSNRSEVGRPHTVEVQCNDEDGRSVLPSPIQVPIPPRSAPADHPAGWDLAANIVLNLAAVPIPREGIYTIEILIDGQHVKSLPFRARRGGGKTA